MVEVLLRKAGPNESRCIVRHQLGFYTNVVVAATYTIPRNATDSSELQQLGFYAHALTECIKKHPFLSATVRGPLSKEPTFFKPDQIHLANHFRVIAHPGAAASHSDTEQLFQKLLELLHNSPKHRFTEVENKPAWAIDVYPLPADGSSQHCVFISFTYSHSHGDGLTGPAFHRTFHEALQKSLKSGTGSQNLKVDSCEGDLPSIPDTAQNMPISLPYLLLPALGTYLPKFLCRLFGLNGNISGSDEKTWIGSPTFADNNTQDTYATTSVEVAVINAEKLSAVLSVCRKNNVKMTALLNELLVQALRQALAEPSTQEITPQNIVVTTALNLRRIAGVSDDTIGVYGGGAYTRYESTFNDNFWTSVRSEGQRLASAATEGRNQSLGLLRFISNFESWMKDKIGQSRDCSFEASNLGRFSPAKEATEDEAAAVSIEDILFSQPASAVGPPITFNTVSLNGGRMMICTTWQVGALGLAEAIDQTDEEQERAFIKGITTSLNDRLGDLVRSV